MRIPFPPAFEQTLSEQLGNAWPDFVSVHDAPSPISIRVNTDKNFRTEELSPVPWATSGKYLRERPAFTLDPTFHGGAYYVQEPSSMFLEQALLQAAPLKEPIKVLDLCAAPGGKSTHILSLLNDQSFLVSNEIIRSRVNVLTENIQKWGNQNVAITTNDAKDFQALKGVFDVVVVDAPCSGEGLFRKDSAAMKEWSIDNVSLCSKRQQRILKDIWPALKQNGILIYSTCTYNRLENEDNLKWLEQNQDVEFVSLTIDPNWNIMEVKEENVIGYRFFPHKVKGEGFFLSVIRKKHVEYEEKASVTKSAFSVPTKKTLTEVRPWVREVDEKYFIQREQTIQFFPALYQNFIEYLVKNLRVVYAGTFLGTLKHDKVIPEHTLALSKEVEKNFFFKINLSEEQALKYLRKQTLNLDVQHKGFALAMYAEVPIGWINCIPGRLNNLYPQEWRIRMA